MVSLRGRSRAVLGRGCSSGGVVSSSTRQGQGVPLSPQPVSAPRQGMGFGQCRLLGRRRFSNGFWTLDTSLAGLPGMRSPTAPKTPSALEQCGTGYVLAGASSAEVPTGTGAFRADALVEKVPKRARRKLSAGRGAKGHRFHDWAVIDLAEAAPGRRQLLIRRIHSTGELAYYPLTPPHRHPWPPWSRPRVSDGG